MNAEYLILYGCNVAVSGKDYGAIYALPRGKVYNVPSTLIDLIAEWRCAPFSEVAALYLDQEEIYTEYVTMLMAEGLAFFTDTPDLFPPLEIVYHSGEQIKSAIIAYDSKYSFAGLIRVLNDLNCKMLEIRLGKTIADLGQLENLLDLTRHSTLRQINIYMDLPENFNKAKMDALISDHKKLNAVTFVCAGYTSQYMVDNCSVDFVPCSLGALLLGHQQKNTLLINYEYFMESHFHNPLYNQQVYISEDGEIKNHHQEVEVFGNINVDDLTEIVSMSSFREKWSLNGIPAWLSESPLRYGIFNPEQILLREKIFHNQAFTT